MTTPKVADARRAVLTAAVDEAERRGDRRIGTDHLLLGLLHDAGGLARTALDVDLVAARTADRALDRAALAAVGIAVPPLPEAEPVRSRRRRPLTSAARAVLLRSVHSAVHATPRRRAVDERDLLLALLACERPDPAAELLAALGVDRAAAEAAARRRVDDGGAA